MLKENLQQVFELPSSFWQTQWNTVCEWSGNNEFILITWGMFIVSIAIFWIIGLVFFPNDLTGKSQSVMKYRMQRDSLYPENLNEFGRAAVRMVFNQVAVNLPQFFGCVSNC